MHIVSSSQEQRGCESKNCWLVLFGFDLGFSAFVFIKMFISDGNDPVKRKDFSRGRGCFT